MAFGYDEQQIDRVVHAGERRKRLAVGITAAVVVIGGGAAAWGWTTLATASGVSRLAQGFLAPARVSFGDVAVDRPGGLFAPGSWQVTFTGVQIGLPGGGTATLDRVVVPWRDLADARLLGARDIHTAEVTGFTVNLPSQPPLAPFEPAEGTKWAVGEVILSGGTVEIAADGLRRGARVEGISGKLEKVGYDTGARLLDGKGELRAERATIGTLAVEAPAVRVVTKSSTIGFEGTAGLLGTNAKITGQVEHVHQGAGLKLVVEPEALSVESLVSAWTGSPSPLNGPLAGRIAVRAGGDIPRGAPTIETEGTIVGARLALGPASREVSKLTPTLPTDKATGEVVLPDLVGKIALEPAGASVVQLSADGAIQTRLRGPLAPEAALIVRTVSSMDWWSNPGRGAVVTHASEAWAVRPATREELLPPQPPPAPATPAPPASP